MAECGENKEIANLDEQKQVASGFVFTWGLGKEGQLGLGNLENQATPQVVSITQKGKKLKILATKISCGGHSTVIVTPKGAVFTWGTGKHGRLGHGSDNSELSPKQIDRLKDVPVKDVVAGDWHMVAVTHDNQVYGWGAAKAFGQARNVVSPILVPMPESISIKMISAGHHYSALLSVEGRVFTFGSGCLGIDEVEVNTPTLVTSLAPETIVSIGCGYYHAGAVADNGKLYMWGKNESGQLGLGDSEPRRLPTLVPHSNETPFLMVSCSKGEFHGHSAAISRDGGLYTWGSGYKGKLGHQEWSHKEAEDCNVAFPRRVEAFNDCYVISVACGGIHTAALTADGVVHTWGCGSDGRLGHPESDDHTYLFKECFPRPVAALQGKTAHQIECSYYHSVAIASQ